MKFGNVFKSVSFFFSGALVFQQEISTLISLGRTDIRGDPVLFDACAEDLERHCQTIPHGGGRRKESFAQLILHS